MGSTHIMQSAENPNQTAKKENRLLPASCQRKGSADNRLHGISIDQNNK
jgi:hypothetical protein